MELRDLGISAIDSGLVEKLSGDNSKDEKQRVMVLFKTRYMNTFVIQIVNTGLLRVCKVLISTDVCGMGTDVTGLSLIINLGG